MYSSLHWFKCSIVLHATLDRHNSRVQRENSRIKREFQMVHLVF